MSRANNQTITVGELIDHLKGYSRDWNLIFGDDQLTFYRTKQRGDDLVQIEFSEIFEVIPTHKV